MLHCAERNNCGVRAQEHNASRQGSAPFTSEAAGSLQSAHCRAGSPDAKMRARHQTQVSAEVVTKTGETFQRLDRERAGSDCFGRGKSSADNRRGPIHVTRLRASSDGRVGIHLGRTSRTVLEPQPCAPFLALVASSWRYVNVYTCLTPGGT